jgi:hypothetical protein
MYKVIINNEEFDLNQEEARTMLTERAYKLLYRTRRQGGSIKFGIGAVKDYFKKEFETVNQG